eukprot:15481618-Alexandrium_andersonii.AAC.1
MERPQHRPGPAPLPSVPAPKAASTPVSRHSAPARLGIHTPTEYGDVGSLPRTPQSLPRQPREPDEPERPPPGIPPPPAPFREPAQQPGNENAAELLMKL